MNDRGPEIRLSYAARMGTNRDGRDDSRRRLPAGSVTRRHAEHLWEELIAGRRTWQQTSDDAIALVEQVDAENKIVDKGLLWLYYLWQSEDLRRPDVIIEARRRFRAELAECDTDPVEWECQYYLRMLRGFRSEHGLQKTLRFARNLRRSGLIRQQEVAELLRDGPGFDVSQPTSADVRVESD